MAWPKEGLPTDPPMPCGEGSDLELLGRASEELPTEASCLPAVPAQLSHLRTVVIKIIDEERQIVPLFLMCPPGLPMRSSVPHKVTPIGDRVCR